jgi:GNAT superfamily N-acetyltransferase
MEINAVSRMIRKANSSDIPLLVLHHVTMFQAPVDSELGRCYHRKLELDIPSGMCHMWIVEVEGIAVASGGISLARFVPTPWDHNPIVAYVHSIFTLPEHRQQGHANGIMLSIDHFCKEFGIHRQWLNASDMGRPIYEKLGFKPNLRMMQKDI